MEMVGGPPAITVVLVDWSMASKKGLLVVVAKLLSQPKLIPLFKSSIPMTYLRIQMPNLVTNF